MAVSREVLYEQVWAEPMTKVAERYSVSANYLARIGRRMNIPIPGRGYWAKHAVGKAPTRPELPQAEPTDELEWIRPGEMAGGGALQFRRPRVEDDGARQNSERPKCHALVAQGRPSFLKAREFDDGYLRPYKRAILDVVVTKKALSRALDLASSLLLAFEDRGHRVRLAPFHERFHVLSLTDQDHVWSHRRWRPDRPTVVYLGTLPIGLTLFELEETAEFILKRGRFVRKPRSARRGGSPPDNYRTEHSKDVPSGRLCIRAYCPYHVAAWEREWPEAERGELKGKLVDVVRQLEADFDTIVKIVQEGQGRAALEQKEREARMREWEREEAHRQRQRAVEDSRKELLGIVQDWMEAREIEAFVKDVSRRSTKLGKREQSRLNRRLKIVRSLLRGQDSLSRFRSWSSPEDRLRH